MTTFVFEAEVMVPMWHKEWLHYYLDEDVVAKLLKNLTPEQNGVIENVDELHDLLTTTGQISTVNKLDGRNAQVMNMLTALAKAAWKEGVPWDVDETEYMYKGDEKFYKYLCAYVDSKLDQNEGEI